MLKMAFMFKDTFLSTSNAGVLIVEAFGQAAAALTAHGIDPKEYENKLAFLMSVDKARFRSPAYLSNSLDIEKDLMVGLEIKERQKLTVKEWLTQNGPLQLLIKNNDP